MVTDPKGTRFDSSNFNPLFYWKAGCQLVSLNYQLNDESLRVHRGLFVDNGKTGYVLKTQFQNLIDEPITSQQNESNLSIKILSFVNNLSHVPSRALARDTYCTIELASTDSLWFIDKYSVPVKNALEKVKDIHSIEDVEKTFKDLVKNIELQQGRNESIISFSLFQTRNNKHILNWLSNDNLVASNSFSLRFLRPGYRIVNLYDDEKHLIGSLLCHIYEKQKEEDIVDKVSNVH